MLHVSVTAVRAMASRENHPSIYPELFKGRTGEDPGEQLARRAGNELNAQRVVIHEQSRCCLV